MARGDQYRARYSEGVVKKLKESGAIKPRRSIEAIEKSLLSFVKKDFKRVSKHIKDGECIAITFDIIRFNENGETYSRERNSADYFKWRRLVYERDSYKCVNCGSKDGITAHHIIPWAKSIKDRYVLANGKTLCKSCHTKEHPHLKFMVDKNDK